MLLPLETFRRLLTAKATLPSPGTLEQAKAKASQGQRWTVELSNTQDGSNKFWEASGAALDAPVTIFWGRLYTPGRSITKDWAYVEKTVPAKLRKGYIYGYPKLSEKQALEKAAKYAAKSLEILVKMAQNVMRGGLGHFWAPLEKVAKEYDLNLDPIHTLLWKDAKDFGVFLKKELETRKKAVEALLGQKLKVTIPSFKPKKPKASGGKQKTNPAALGKLSGFKSDVLYPPVKNYWEYNTEKIPSQMWEEMDDLASSRPALAKVQSLVSGQNFSWTVGEWARARTFEADLKRVVQQLGGS